MKNTRCHICGLLIPDEKTDSMIAKEPRCNCAERLRRYKEFYAEVAPILKRLL